VSYGEFDETFGGDLTGTAAYGDVESVVGPQVGPVEVYKVHHHGSTYSSNDNWLNATTPKVAVIQCGNGNTYGHPTAGALGRLHAHNVNTYWTQTGAGVAPNPAWDKVANGQVIIQATWQPGGVDTIRGNGFADVFTNSGTAIDATPPLVQVLTPNGGESFPAGSMSTIQWNVSDNVGVDSVNVDVSFNGAAGPWLRIVHGVSGTNSATWMVPDRGSDSALVRVTGFDHALNQSADASNNLFQVVPSSALDAPLPGTAVLSFSPPRPNPSQNRVTLRFSLPGASDAQLELLDLSGRRLWSWQQDALAAGEHTLEWDGRLSNGARAGLGIYWMRLGTTFGTRTVKVLRLN
jgi:hypothetical protein